MNVPATRLTFRLAKKIFNKRGELKITWADLLNPAFYFYENIDNKESIQEGTDRLFNSYKPGSTITVGFTYDFNLGKKINN